MPSFTMELFRAIELSPDGDIGLNDYPIFDEEYRAGLNKKIIDHYFMREIGMETLDIFRFSMRRRMNEVMPYYNDLYLTTKIEFDPLSTMDIRSISHGESTAEADATSTATNSTENESGSRAVQSTTPQVMLSGNGDYASSGADTTSKSNASGVAEEASESSTAQKNRGESRTTGYQGSPVGLIAEYRRSLINIDMLVVDELADLFMGVWDNGDNFLPYPFSPLPTF